MIISDDLILKFQADFMKKFCRIDEKIRRGLQEFVQLNRKNDELQKMNVKNLCDYLHKNIRITGKIPFYEKKK